MNENKKKYEVSVKVKSGSCDSTIFEKMAKRGDITAEKVAECVGRIVKITGHAECHIATDEKEFDLNYFATNDGFISSGSEIFLESVVDYIGEVNTFRIAEIKTKKGKTYKAVPILVDKEETENKNEETTNNEEMPF